jgi:hypothetical protein
VLLRLVLGVLVAVIGVHVCHDQTSDQNDALHSNHETRVHFSCHSSSSIQPVSARGMNVNFASLNKP